MFDHFYQFKRESRKKGEEKKGFEYVEQERIQEKTKTCDTLTQLLMQKKMQKKRPGNAIHKKVGA